MEINDFEAIDRSVEALTALSILLEEAICHDPAALTQQGYGIGLLIRTQLDTIRDRADHLGAELREKRAEEARAFLSAAGALPEAHGKAVLPEPHVADPASILRDADLLQIARDVNLKEDTVRRVVERLLSGSGNDSPILNRPPARLLAEVADVSESLVLELYKWLDAPAGTIDAMAHRAGKEAYAKLIAQDLQVSHQTVAYLLHCKEKLEASAQPVRAAG